MQRKYLSTKVTPDQLIDSKLITDPLDLDSKIECLSEKNDEDISYTMRAKPELKHTTSRIEPKN